MRLTPDLVSAPPRASGGALLRSPGRNADRNVRALIRPLRSDASSAMSRNCRSLPPMVLKYHSDVSTLTACPPNTCAPVEPQVAFRFVHADITKRENFLPPAKLSPSRWVKKAPCCEDYALSLFDTQERAVAYFRKLVDSHANIGKSIGDHLAEASLNPVHGLATTAEANGHFDLYEAEGVDLSTAVMPIGPIGNLP